MLKKDIAKRTKKNRFLYLKEYLKKEDILPIEFISYIILTICILALIIYNIVR